MRRSRRASRRGRRARELARGRLVVDGDERALDQDISSLDSPPRTTSGSSRCSTSCRRACSVAGASSSRTGTGSAAIRGRVDALVDECTVAARPGDAVGEHVLDGCAPGKAGRGAGWAFRRGREAVEEVGRSRCMYPAQTTSLGALVREPGGHRGSRSSRAVFARRRRRRSPPAARTVEGGASACCTRPQADGKAGVEQGLEVRALAPSRGRRSRQGA